MRLLEDRVQVSAALCRRAAVGSVLRIYVHRITSLAMTSPKQRAREIQQEIGDVLLRNWDPLGVADSEDHRDEYAAYVGGVYRLLVSNASAREIAEHLARVEADALGFPDTDPNMLIPLAEKLKRLNVRLSTTRPSRSGHE